jgi:hypothetical protein
VIRIVVVAAKNGSLTCPRGTIDDLIGWGIAGAKTATLSLPSGDKAIAPQSGSEEDCLAPGTDVGLTASNSGGSSEASVTTPS